MNNLSPELNIALKAARAGAEIIQERFGNIPKTRIKSESETVVTDTDLAAEKAILKVLREKSDYGIISEESGSTGLTDGPQWVVDPLDGTSNFARALPLFAVSVALMHGSQSLVGVIIDPVLQNEYYAEKGKGAFCNGEKLAIPTSRNDKGINIFLNHGSSDSDKLKCARINEKLCSGYRLRKLGTTALELCYVANGSFDGFICSGDELWDFAAGIVIAEEAGCIFSDWQGNPWKRGENHLLFAWPEIHRGLVENLKGMG
ncbi:MAG: inositol monophosphatase family protein [Tangfeifania sp.]